MSKVKQTKIQVVALPDNKGLCGHCQTGHHQNCVIGVFQSGPTKKYPNGVIILCTCDGDDCPQGRRRCRDCGNRTTEEVNPWDWKCLDRDACKDSLQTRRAANPLYAEIQHARERANMAKTEKAATKAAASKTKEPKVGKCLVTGKATKGGLFLPGMDARYASERVKDVMEKRATKTQALAKMKADGVSAALIGKFEKNLGIAQEKQAKKDAAAKAKADEKKAAASEKAGK